MVRLYVYKGKHATTYFTILKDGSYHNLGHDKHKAKQQLLDLTGPTAFPGTIEALIEGRLTRLKDLLDQGMRAPRSWIDDQIYAKNLQGIFGHLLAVDLTTADCYRYLTSGRGRKAPIRANKEIRWLSGAYRWGMNAGLIATNPVSSTQFNAEVPRDRHITDEELRSFCEYCAGDGTQAGPRVAIAFDLAYLTAKAEAQILRLHRSQVTAEGVYFKKRKGGANTLVEWTPALQHAINAAKALSPGMFLVSTTLGTPYTLGGFKALWQRRMVAWSTATGLPRFTFHDLRAKAITTMKSEGRVASEVSGHREEKTVARVYDRRRVRKGPAVE